MIDVPPGLAAIAAAAIAAIGSIIVTYIMAHRTSQRDVQKSAAAQLAECRERERRWLDERMSLIERNATLAMELAHQRREP